jgi:hypothetical protein
MKTQQITKEGARDQYSQEKNNIPSSSLPVVSYTSSRKPFPSYNTISTYLRLNWDFHMHIFIEQFNVSK